MDWDFIAALIEIVGLVLVFATLVYLATEIRQNTASVNTARYETITTGFNDIDCAIVADPGLARLFNVAMMRPEELNEEEQARMAFVFRMFVNQYQKIFNLFRTGVLPEDEWITYAKQCGQLLGSPGGLIYLGHNTDFPELTKAIQPYMTGEDVMKFAFTFNSEL